LQDAQNKVAAYALFQLFPDFPIHLLITEPYASVVMKWMEGKPFLFYALLNFVPTIL
jgi:ATP-dependent RNA helicase DHX29